MRLYSTIIPVFNRPTEIQELLESLTQQTYRNFEVLVVEDGSTITCKEIVESFRDRLTVSYFYKENSGQGFSRNYGYERAKGDYFVVFDSDCIIPSHYFEAVEKYLNTDYLDAYGGPDKAHHSFTVTQKAISYSMTSLFTTGGIRGRKQHMGTYHPRSFNMGITREVFEKTKGYIIPFMGEDIEFSIRIIENGFKSGLIEEAYVYHKRRTSLRQFFKQLHFFGRARINISRFYANELKAVHFFPLIFLIGTVVYLILPLINPGLFKWASLLFGIYFCLIFLDATVSNRNLKVGFMSMAAAFVQLSAYGIGFLTEGLKKIFRG
ncbi:glycosyltransferase [Fulvivirgaceae bacterium BMA12]|uniref:Glycosyltransferase n=1 Tax=Agaribacillus aureus TaxID=3051825 RepID=A0ABT8LGI3_9BACT|nr:glycosyltransferase [Fulvivirgaceae bacterium BMA12]